MHKVRTKKILTFMVAGVLGLAALWVVGNGNNPRLIIDPSSAPLTQITLKQLNLGDNQNMTEWKISEKTLTVSPKNNSPKNNSSNYASQVGGVKNEIAGVETEYTAENLNPRGYIGYSSVIVVGSGNQVVENSKYGVIAAAENSSLNASEGSVILAAKNGALQAENSAIIASSNFSKGKLNAIGSGSAIIASNNGTIAKGALGSLTIGNDLTISHRGVFAFNGKNENLTSAKDNTFILNADNGVLISKNAPGAPTKNVPLQVNGAIRVLTGEVTNVKNSIILKKGIVNGKPYSCLCLGGKTTGANLTLGESNQCPQICNGELAQIVKGQWECLPREYLFKNTDLNLVYSRRQNPSLPLAECRVGNCAGERPVCGDRCVQGYEQVDNGDGTYRCEETSSIDQNYSWEVLPHGMCRWAAQEFCLAKDGSRNYVAMQACLGLNNAQCTLNKDCILGNSTLKIKDARVMCVNSVGDFVNTDFCNSDLKPSPYVYCAIPPTPSPSDPSTPLCDDRTSVESSGRISGAASQILGGSPSTYTDKLLVNSLSYHATKFYLDVRRGFSSPELYIPINYYAGHPITPVSGEVTIKATISNGAGGTYRDTIGTYPIKTRIHTYGGKHYIKVIFNEQKGQDGNTLYGVPCSFADKCYIDIHEVKLNLPKISC